MASVPENVQPRKSKNAEFVADVAEANVRLVMKQIREQYDGDVFRTEILQVIDGVPGVDHVLSLELAAEGTTGQCGNLCVGPLELVAPGRHSIEVQ